MPKLCSVCKNEVGAMSGSLLCRPCKEKAAFEKRREAGEKISAEAKSRNLLLLHSCISNLHDPMPKTCRCRKFVNFEVAREYIKLGRAVDFQTRKASFYERAIVEVSKHKNPPISTIGSRVAVERKIVTPIDEKTLARLQATAEEDRVLRAAERDVKIEIENEITRQERSKLIVSVDEKEFEETKKRSWGRPGIFNRIEERTSIGRDVGSNAETELAEAA